MWGQRAEGVQACAVDTRQPTLSLEPLSHQPDVTQNYIPRTEISRHSLTSTTGFGATLPVWPLPGFIEKIRGHV